MIIYKYSLAVAEVNTIHAPVGAVILDIQDQNGIMSMWMLLDETELANERRRFIIVGTGKEFKHPPKGRLVHVKSVQLRGFVWHIFEEKQHEAAQLPRQA
jgi:hypothetical protein